MSSPQSPDEQDDPTEADPTGADPTEEESPEEPPAREASETTASEMDASEAVAETTQCPNCGHEFTSNYCPECGQKADPSASFLEVIGGFFRELVDVENGFWPTFVGLTLRPGKTLQQYLSGVRKGLIGPGRYLLAAVVVTVGTRQLSRWIGARPTPVVDPYMTTADGKREAIGASVGYVISATEQAPILPFLLIAAPLALSLWTLFSGRFSGGAEALAVGSFLVAHTAFLTAGIELAYAGAGYPLIGSSIELPLEAVIVFLTAYVGFACWGCFGPGWKPAAKGALGAAWACGEGVAIVGIAFTGISFWLCRADPSAYYFVSPEETQIGFFLFFAGIVSVPLLLHAGVEAYYRLR